MRKRRLREVSQLGQELSLRRMKKQIRLPPAQGPHLLPAKPCASLPSSLCANSLLRQGSPITHEASPSCSAASPDSPVLWGAASVCPSLCAVLLRTSLRHLHACVCVCAHRCTRPSPSSAFSSLAAEKETRMVFIAPTSEPAHRPCTQWH